MNLIVAVDSNWAIGYNNDLLVKIPADLRFFREETINKVVIMGRKTLETFPSGQPLPQRLNIVLTKDLNFKMKDTIVVNSVEAALQAVKGYASEDVYVIGGATIYNQFLAHCDVAYVTKIQYAYEADTFFPNIDQMEDWELTGESEEQTYHDLIYTFNKYQRKK